MYDRRERLSPPLAARPFSSCAWPKPPVPPIEIEDLNMPVCTNAEVFGGFAPLIVKWVVMSNGSLRHIGEPEWHARGSEIGTRLSNADIKALGGTL